MTYEKVYHIYIMTNQPNGTLYFVVTSYLSQRVYQHKNKTFKGLSASYSLDKLIYYKAYNNAQLSITHEKQLKKFFRKQKLALINTFNPAWQDLYATLA